MFHYHLLRAALYWKRILIVLLLGISAYELFEAGKFFLVELPELENGLKVHEVSQLQLQDFTASAIAEAVVSCVNIFFAVRLHKIGEKIIQFFDLISSSGLVVLHTTVVEWLSAIDYVAIWQRLW